MQQLALRRSSPAFVALPRAASWDPSFRAPCDPFPSKAFHAGPIPLAIVCISRHGVLDRSIPRRCNQTGYSSMGKSRWRVTPHSTREIRDRIRMPGKDFHDLRLPWGGSGLSVPVVKISWIRMLRWVRLVKSPRCSIRIERSESIRCGIVYANGSIGSDLRG
jgi:hypothetical protein